MRYPMCKYLSANSEKSKNREKQRKRERKKHGGSIKKIVSLLRLILKQLELWSGSTRIGREKRKNGNCTSINNKFRNNVGKRWIFLEEEGDDYGRKNSIVESSRGEANNEGSRRVKGCIHGGQ